ncbi:zygotic DNA replication licensing factor mcm3, partial [Trichonephila clavata]
LPIHTSADFLATKNPDVEEEQEENTPIYESLMLFSMELDQKWIKLLVWNYEEIYPLSETVKPTLTPEACERLSEEYARLRAFDTQNTDIARTQPVTARSLETLIRLSTAHAKARMSNTISLKDAQAAIDLVQFAYFKTVLEKEKKRRRPEQESSDEESEEIPKKKKPTKPRAQPGEEGYDPYDFEEDPSGAPRASTSRSGGSSQPASTSAARSEDTDVTMMEES